ncbi:MAG: TonB-dependent receptor [Burkholderiales bacterium]|nr:TonB-dependent receptor [Burkholderiales bacterium]
MTNRYKTLRRALATAGVLTITLGTAGLQSALAQTPPAQEKKPERIEVTGSAIKRVDAEGPAPIEIITREDIRRSGASTINELIKSIPVIDTNDQGELASNSPGGSGTARVALRGLGSTQTLVLVNGRRMPVNPLSDTSGAGHAFDINQIPVSAIERVEILKDGGSAIYGADAVAGVINFILRKDFRGYEAKASYGESSRGDGAEKQFGFTAGWGDISRDRYNILAAVDVFKRDPIFRKDRDISSTSDYRRFGPIAGFNLDGRSVFAPQGNILTPQGTLAGTTVRPCPPESQSGPLCVYDFNRSLLTAYNGADRMNALVIGTYEVSSSMTATAQFNYSSSEDLFEAHPVPAFFPLPGGGGNYAGRFMQGGPRITEREGTFHNLQLALEGNHSGLDWKVGLSSGEAKVTNQDRNYYNANLWNPALAAGRIDATSSNNDPAFVESLKVSPRRVGKVGIDLFDALVSGDAFKLGGGPVRYAVGVNFWRESNTDTPDPLSVLGQVVGSIQQSRIDKTRNATGIFAELQLPVTRDLEVQAAVRYDKYDSASRSSPKIGAKWQLNRSLAMRASYSKSFKMPTLKQLFGNPGEGAINLTSEQCQAINLPAGCNLPAFRVTGSNPNLKPELGDSLNVGFVADLGQVSFSLDWWEIDKEDNITTPTILSALQQGFFFRTPDGRLNVLQNLQNFSQAQTQGQDADVRINVGETGWGNLTLRALGTHYTRQRTRTTASDPWAEFNGTYAAPRWRSSYIATLEKGPWTVQGLWRTVSGFYDTVQPAENFSLLQTVRRVGVHEELDLTVSWRGMKNLTLSAAVKNALDNMPPFSATNATNNNFTQLGFAELYTNRGRFWQFSASYQF